MPDNAMTTTRPQLVAPRATAREVILEASRSGFDPDLYAVMNSADDGLIADDVLRGSISGIFVYDFKIAGSDAKGVSVIGARHLARQYGKLQHRIVASIEKRGALFRFTSYPTTERGMDVTCSIMPELEEDPDHYTVVVEIKDISNGNSIQMERTEMRQESRRDGTKFDRPNFATIAQSKAYRNAVLALVPQDVLVKFRDECLARGKSKDMTDSAIDLKRAAVLEFCAKHAIVLQRSAVMALGWEQISGLRAAVENGLPAFVQSCVALGLMQQDEGKSPPAQAQIEKPRDQPLGEIKPTEEREHVAARTDTGAEEARAAGERRQDGAARGEPAADEQQQTEGASPPPPPVAPPASPPPISAAAANARKPRPDLSGLAKE